MRILVASGTWYPDRNGVARVAAETAQRLAARGHEVVALVPTLVGQPREERERSLLVRRVVTRGLLPQSITDVRATRRAAGGDGSFDLLLAHGPGMAVALARAQPRTPLVLVYHASHARELRFTRPRLPWRRERVVSYVNEPVTRVLERSAVESCARILVLSDFSRSLLLADHPHRMHKVRRVSGGVDVTSFSPDDGARERLGLDPDARLLLTVRRAEPRMGIEQLLRALVRLETDVRLAVVGGGLLTQELQRLTTGLGLSNRVSFPGRVSENDLRDWYRAADVFVLPTIAYEGFGMVTVEALASGTPVVGTPVGATPELLEPLEPRLVAGGDDPPSLAAAIGDALGLADADFRSRCRDYAVRRFDWDGVMVGWEETLFNAVAGLPVSASCAG